MIALALDEFFRYKRSAWRPAVAGEPGAFEDDPTAAHRFASRWLMIPLSRAVDTLVLEIGPSPSPVRDALTRVAARCPDFVEWYTLTSA